MSVAEDIANVELAIEKHKVSIARKQALDRLEKNPDFKLLITDGFLEQHAIRQVMLKAHPSLQSPETQQLLDNQINAIGNFKQFLINVFTEGSNAEEAMSQDEETLADLLKEDLGDE